jgi:two-component sensor histidine kinase
MSQIYNEHKIDYHKALDYLFKAVDANKKRNSISGLSYNYGNIAYAYTMLGKHKESLHYARLMLDAGQQMQRPDRLQNAYGQMYRSFKGAGMIDSALAYYVLQDKLNDSLTNLGKTREVLDLQARYETNQKELEIQQLQVQREASTRNIIWLLAGIGLLTGIMIWLFILYRNMAKQKKEISEQRLRLEVMMKELHHRVKNNLQIVSSLLSLQTNRLEDENAIAVLKESQLRVQAMSFIHQRLYKTDSITSVNMKEYITDLAESLVASYGYHRDDFDLQLEVKQEFLDIDKALPAGLIINELVTNALKYAYGNVQRPLLQISLLNNAANDVVIAIRDNGKGIDAEAWTKQRNSFGKQLITALCKQLRASQELKVENGTQFTITIPAQAA